MLVLLIGDFHVPHRKIDLPARFKKLLVPGKIQQILSTGNLTSTDMYDYLRTIAPNVVTVRGDMDEFLPGSGSGSAATVTHSTTHSTTTSVQQPPHAKVIQHGLIRIGLLHGHQLLPWGDVQALGIAARQLDVDVLVSGHTHEFAAYEYEGRFFVNPGSATGAFSLVFPGTAVAPQDYVPPTPPTPPAATVADGSPTSKDSDSNDNQDDAVEQSDLPQSPTTNIQPSSPPPHIPPSSLVETTPSFVLMDIQGTSIVLYVYKLIDGEVKVEKLDYEKSLDITNPI
ncbi:hypothetical protein BDV3_004691 [Batrachochytrium dendrobatidis]|uniref:Vacuolar protein sorting-associated protein 29 n=1 Tax=Batrachochytrium dendrobatidis (strain JEL423) TaxID=403673 RepID=A0A177WJY1_BATDL|nr:Vacuolar protein sorting-associated protein 29 [Batrachochytrium dendrobatidis]KAK5671198.1 Vacuolar protein sorting-associated protein 29 [Batrachochytrium dendrobatidis]OAJ40122.1 hypothetical protein BDEG_23890 [Batrachochytrium dendrobatidis JEL423]